MKQDKYLKRAIDAFGLKFSESRTPLTISDLDNLLSEEKMTLAECESGLIEIKEAIEILKVNIQNLESIKHQVKVERYKDLNDKKELDIF